LQTIFRPVVVEVEVNALPTGGATTGAGETISTLLRCGGRGGQNIPSTYYTVHYYTCNKKYKLHV